MNSNLNFNIICCDDNGLGQWSMDGNDDGDSTPLGDYQISSHIPFLGSLRRILLNSNDRNT